MNRPLAKRIVFWVVVLFVLIQGIQPRRMNPPVTPSRSLEAHVNVPPQVQSVLQRTCYNCHSSGTVWPWYSRVAPVSWYVVHDVNAARSHINFQDWEAQVSPQEGKEHLGLICKLIQNGQMPPADYRLMHKDGNLAPEEASAVCDWSKQFADSEDSDKKAD